MMKEINIALPNLFIVILTSSLPPEYEPAVVTLDSINLKDLTFKIMISCLFNEEELQLSQKLLQDSKAIKRELEPNFSYATHVGKLNITCFMWDKETSLKGLP